MFNYTGVSNQKGDFYPEKSMEETGVKMSQRNALVCEARQKSTVVLLVEEGISK